MQLALLTALTMLAFAANSVLNRLALADGGIDAASFGAVRLLAGAVTLGALCILLRGGLKPGGPHRLAGVVALLTYIFGFSLAYRALDAGLGALILFGTVQITMFAGALIGGERPAPLRWAGTAMALGGLGWLVWPGAAVAVPMAPALWMAAAGIGWGLYSLVGRSARDALQSTAANFLLAAPAGLALSLLLAPSGLTQATPTGFGLAVLSGAVTSGLGYALWYSVLPRLAASLAAVAQLTVPAIATAGGILFLGEALTDRFLIASALILGGVALAALAPKR